MNDRRMRRELEENEGGNGNEDRKRQVKMVERFEGED